MLVQPGLPFDYERKDTSPKPVVCWPFPSWHCLFIKSSLRVKLFNYTKMCFIYTFIALQIELIFIRNVLHEDAFWNRGRRQPDNGLFTSRILPALTTCCTTKRELWLALCHICTDLIGQMWLLWFCLNRVTKIALSPSFIHMQSTLNVLTVVEFCRRFPCAYCIVACVHRPYGWTNWKREQSWTGQTMWFTHM